MRRRRSAAVFAVSLLAHIGVFAAWFATHPRPLFVEPATMQIELIRPPPRAKPPPKLTRAAPPIRLHLANPASSPDVAPLLAPTPPPTAEPSPTGPHAFTDEELLAGPKPSIEALRNAGGRDMQFRGPLPPPCKPANQRAANDPAPPCPVFKETAEGRRKDAIRTYKGQYGSQGLASPNDYPGLRCTFLHSHCEPPKP